MGGGGGELEGVGSFPLWRFIELLEKEDDSLYRSWLFILFWIPREARKLRRF